MKNWLLALTTILLLSFTFEETKKTFQSNNKKVSITSNETWKAKANMKGVEVYIQKKFPDNTEVSIVISKDEGLLTPTSLEKYSAGKIFLQTTVLKTAPQIAKTKTINNLKMKVYEYEYSDKELIQKHSIIYHCVIGTTGYQIALTSSQDNFELSRPMYNEIINTISIQ